MGWERVGLKYAIVFLEGDANCCVIYFSSSTMHMYEERFWNEQKNCEAIFCRSERLRVQIPVNSPVPFVHCQPIVAWESPGRIVMGTGDLYPLQEPIGVLHASLHVIMPNAVQDRGTYSWILLVNIYIFIYPFLCVAHYLNIEHFFKYMFFTAQTIRYNVLHVVFFFTLAKKSPKI